MTRFKKRQFKVGDEVLALLSIRNHPLHARYHGPYVIAKKVSEVDYVEYTRTAQGIVALPHKYVKGIHSTSWRSGS